MTAGHGEREADVLDPKDAAGGAELDVSPTEIGIGAEAEAERAASQRVEALAHAHHQRLTRPRAEHGEHRRHLRRVRGHVAAR